MTSQFGQEATNVLIHFSKHAPQHLFSLIRPPLFVTTAPLEEGELILQKGGVVVLKTKTCVIVLTLQCIALSLPLP